MKVTMTAKAAQTCARLVFCGWGKEPEAAKKLMEAGRLDASGIAAKEVETAEGVLICVGKGKQDDVRHLKDAVAAGVRMAAGEKAKSLAIDLGTYGGAIDAALAARSAAAACCEATYRFEWYQEKKKPCTLTETVLVHPDGESAAMQEAAKLGAALGAAVCQARDAVNRTSRDMTPEALGAWAVSLCEGAPVETELLDQAALEALGAKSLLSVSLGAHYPPMMAVLRYKGAPEQPNDVTVLIGKGITYDSGGLSLKTKNGMITMHGDMGGAAATAAAFSVIVHSGLHLNVTAILPMCENMLSPDGYRPGDIIGSMDGKTIQIRSTDAEGRLALIDAMTYAIRHEKASRMVDIATLTGGAAAAYGPLVSAVAVTDGKLREAMHAASAVSGELMWEMPVVDDYISYLKTDHADIANSSIAEGSSMINAAVFLKQFAGETPWMHIDIAGKSWVRATSGCNFAGGTGTGTIALYDLCAFLAGNK